MVADRRGHPFLAGISWKKIPAISSFGGIMLSASHMHEENAPIEGLQDWHNIGLMKAFGVSAMPYPCLCSGEAVAQPDLVRGMQMITTSLPGPARD